MMFNSSIYNGQRNDDANILVLSISLLFFGRVLRRNLRRKRLRADNS